MAKKWKQALSLVEKSADLLEKLSDTAEKLVETLTEDHKYSDAAEIEYQFWGMLKHLSNYIVNNIGMIMLYY